METDPTVPELRRPGPIMLKIPGYKLLEELGEGGMGTVFRAEQESPRRPVAIKVLHTRSQSAWIRFQTEAQVMARLDHPGIARVLEAGEADGQAFLAMEYVAGVTLDRFVTRRPLRERLELFVQLCDAVHHAHVKGVIHRDLKPANVMVRDGGRVVVLDFGVARLADENTPGTTRAGELLGTPLYMSPEQARMRPDEIDARTDVYTLGVMLYELCSDELPHNGRGMPMPVLTVAICEDDPVPLGKRDPALRGDLDAITAKALEKDPARRYASVAALADDVRRHLDGRAVSVRAPGTMERTRRFVRRRPVAAFAILMVSFGLTAFAAIVTSLWLDARAARETAEHERSVAEDARAKAVAARTDLEARTNQLLLRQARAALVRDPTEALAWLAQLTQNGEAAAAIAEEARARGVAAAVLRGHNDEVHWVEAVQGGFVTGGYDGKVIVWDGSPRTIYTAKHGRVHLVRPAPDGQRFAIGCDDGVLAIVARDGTLIAELPGHAGDVQHIAWSADGAWLASGDDHGNVLLWPHGRAPGTRLPTGTTAIGLVMWAGNQLVAGDHSGALWAWDPATGARVQGKPGAEQIDAWSDGKTLITVDADGAVRTWRLPGLELARTVTTGLKTKRAAFAADGSFAVLGGIGGTVTRVDDKVTPIGQHHAQVRAVAIAGTWIATASDDGSVIARDTSTGRELDLRGHTGRIRHLAFAGTSTLLSSDSDGVIRRWELAQVPPDVLPAGEGPVQRLATDGTRIAAADATGAISVTALADGGHHQLGVETARVTALAIAGDAVVAGTAEGALTWWRASGPTRMQLAGSIKDIAVSSDRVAVATSKGPIAMFTRTGEPLPAIAGNEGGTECLAFDASGDLLASGGQDRVVRVWRRDGTSVALPGPAGDTHFVAFAGDRLISAGNDGVVLAWTKLAPASRVELAHHTGAVTALEVTAAHVASAGRDATVIVDGISTKLDAAATSLVLDDAGHVLAVTRAGALVRGSTTEIEQGVTAVLRSASRYVRADADGTLVLSTLAR
jgi:WD40 repeat protein/predicted Ser/Thr protein kinase